MDDLSEIVYFYGVKDWKEFFFMSNFYRAPILIDEKIWPTSEHYYQAMKFSKQKVEKCNKKDESQVDLVEKVRLSKNPKQATVIGRTFTIRKDWPKVKEGFMEIALKAKFTQHKDLQMKLLKTEKKKLVERTPKDSYWGDGGDGSGQNRLGYLLEKVRDNLLVELKSSEFSKIKDDD